MNREIGRRHRQAEPDNALVRPLRPLRTTVLHTEYTHNLNRIMLLMHYFITPQM